MASGETGRSGKGAIAAGRLAPADYARNFADLHPPLNPHEALVESDRCYFCYDAPCQQACPTSIDIPQFIREINTGNPLGAAQTILNANIMGGMCARVCPVETLCEAACVREHAERKPVKIGLLQRHATDALMASGRQPFTRGAATGKTVAVVGGGPAGLACAHALAQLGHTVTVYEARAKLGGLNEYGIAAYKTVDDFAAKEVAFILGVGGIEVKLQRALGAQLSLDRLRASHDAVFLALGLAGVNRLGLPQEDNSPGIKDAVQSIATLRQAQSLAELPVGRRVVVIGGGMTAIDAAVQSKRLGAQEVTLVYRRGREHMKASHYEQELALINGVQFVTWAVPKTLHASTRELSGVTLEKTAQINGRLAGTGELIELKADVLLSAIGQLFVADALAGQGIALESGRIKVDGERRTSVAGLWAGGDCIAGGQDLTVSAVEDGKQAALSIDRFLRTA